MAEFKIDPDYKEVAERLRDLFAKFPEASMRGTYEFVEGHVIYRAECYRTPDDQAPGVGTAWEEVPGRTPYTKGSELQNAETSAWGRAIVAVGASESKRIASADDIRLANDRRDAPPAAPLPPQEPPDGYQRGSDLHRWCRGCKAWLAVGAGHLVAHETEWSNVDESSVDPPEASLLAGQPDADGGAVMGRAESLANEATRAAEPNLDDYSEEPF